MVILILPTFEERNQLPKIECLDLIKVFAILWFPTLYTHETISGIRHLYKVEGSFGIFKGMWYNLGSSEISKLGRNILKVNSSVLCDHWCAYLPIMGNFVAQKEAVLLRLCGF